MSVAAFPRKLCDHDGDTVPLMPAPVSRLTLAAAVGDGVAVDACEQHLFTSHSLLAHGAGFPILHGLGVKLGHLYF